MSVVGAVGLVDQMGTANGPVEDNGATQRPFTHDDPFAVFAATSTKGHFRIEAVIAGIHGIRAVVLGCTSPMLEFAVLARLICLASALISDLLPQTPLIFGSVPQGL